MLIKNPNGSSIENQTRDLLSCSAVPQTTSPPRVPLQITRPRIRLTNLLTCAQHSIKDAK